MGYSPPLFPAGAGAGAGGLKFLLLKSHKIVIKKIFILSNLCENFVNVLILSFTYITTTDSDISSLFLTKKNRI